MQFGRFRFLDIGDLNSQPLYDLVCPRDRIGAVDVYLVAHHGNSTVADPATLAAFRPRVAVVNNAPRKGGRLALLQMLRKAQDLDAWQLHVSSEAAGDNAPPERIANLDDASAHWLKVTARADGSFTRHERPHRRRPGVRSSSPMTRVRECGRLARGPFALFCPHAPQSSHQPAPGRATAVPDIRPGVPGRLRCPADAAGRPAPRTADRLRRRGARIPRIGAAAAG